jgi:putative molybdopterin biosynthesis protein
MIETVARQYGLGLISVQNKHYDFAAPKSWLERAAVRRFWELLALPNTRAALAALGFRL